MNQQHIPLGVEDYRSKRNLARPIHQIVSQDKKRGGIRSRTGEANSGQHGSHGQETDLRKDTT